ncbi:porin [Pantoea sp. 18069]|uniref:porin n=1 Tax=Pantoea sp. 18069 TaxID=2681415 RepID=UPI00135C84CA|nr:porin [Pantoea sp. 18069]
MKKSVLAMAAAAATFPFSIYAQSNVTLYGRLNVGVEHLSYGSTPTRSSSHLTAMTSDASLWGVRGSEDLGDGYRAYFKLESGFQADTGAATDAGKFFNRESYVGLSNPRLGSLQLGSQWAPGLWQSLRADPFLRFGPGGQPYLLQVQRGYTLRYDNAIQYITPKWGGASARLYHALGESQAVGRASAVSIDYDNGPFYVGAYVEQSRVAGASVGLPGGPVSSRTTSVAASYNLTVVKLHAQAQTNRVDGLANVNGYLLGASVPVGVGQIKASYVHKDANNADASSLGMGYWHSLSKRTTLYVNVARLSNKNMAAYRLGPALAEQAALGAAGPSAGQRATAVHLGMLHTF